MIADTLSRLINIELTEPNHPQKEGHEYGYALLEPLQDKHVDNSKHIPILLIGISNMMTHSA